MDKIRVNGRGRHPLYAALTKVEDDKGRSGDVRWNFEKFVIAPDDSVRRFSNKTLPDDPRVIAAIEDGLATSAPASVESRTGAA